MDINENIDYWESKSYKASDVDIVAVKAKLTDALNILQNKSGYDKVVQHIEESIHLLDKVK